jgi:hypothetical protein
MSAGKRDCSVRLHASPHRVISDVVEGTCGPLPRKYLLIYIGWARVNLEAQRLHPTGMACCLGMCMIDSIYLVWPQGVAGFTMYAARRRVAQGPLGSQFPYVGHFSRYCHNE